MLKYQNFIANTNWWNILDLITITITKEEHFRISCVQKSEKGEHITWLHVFGKHGYIFRVGWRNLKFSNRGVVEVLQFQRVMRIIRWKSSTEYSVVVNEVLIDCKSVVYEISSIAFSSVTIKNLLSTHDSSICDHSVPLALVVVLPVSLLISNVVQHISIRNKCTSFFPVNIKSKDTCNYCKTTPYEFKELIFPKCWTPSTDSVELSPEAFHAILRHCERVRSLQKFLVYVSEKHWHISVLIRKNTNVREPKRFLLLVFLLHEVNCQPRVFRSHVVSRFLDCSSDLRFHCYFIGHEIVLWYVKHTIVCRNAAQSVNTTIILAIIFQIQLWEFTATIFHPFNHCREAIVVRVVCSRFFKGNR
mmetsp:Transcript_2755/g.3989  ORF Transcript_2755/g.3989 Transcript_2755/m.3989 type:complete len:361 (+) Transcript_2755:553-1635(+)